MNMDYIQDLSYEEKIIFLKLFCVLIKTDNDGVIEEWKASEVKKLKDKKQKEEKEEELVMEE